MMTKIELEQDKPFEGLFGDTTELRAIQFLLPLKGMEFTFSNFSELMELSIPTTHKILKKFTAIKILTVVPVEGQETIYQVNKKNAFLKIFENLNNEIISIILHEMEGE